MKFIPYITVLIFFAGMSFAQDDIQLRASVSKNAVKLNEQLSYSLEIKGESSSLPGAEYPDFKNFFILSGPNQSTNIQWINGKMSASKTNTFYLQARKTGKLAIPPATLSYKGKSYSSNSIVVTVTKSGAPSSGKTQTKSRSDSEIDGQNLYIKTFISKKKIYVGEQITVTYKLYFRSNVRGYNFEKNPSYAGFWIEEFKLPSRPVIENEVVNGINYNVAILKKVALFPTQAGDLIIDPLQVTLEATVQSKRNRRSLFDSFFDDPFGRTVQKVITTNQEKITVQSLPEAGKPKGYKGAVGRYKFSARVDKPRVKTNEAISLKINLSGVGNIKLAELPKMSIPQDIEQYEPKISSSVNKEQNEIRGSKSAEIILIPRIHGEYQIKPVSFSFFNPRTKKYQTLSSKPIHLQVDKGSGSQTSVTTQSSGLSRREVALLGKDIHYIKETSEFVPINFKPYLAISFWLTFTSALLLFMVFIIIDDKNARISGDERLARKRRAGKLASKQLSIARARLTDENKELFFKALSQALQGFIRDKLNLELTDFSAVNIQKVLSGRGLPEDEITEYQAVLQESDFNQFAGIGSELPERRELYDRAKSILIRLEKWI